MKKIVFALAILCSLQIANAQQLKDAEAAAKKVAAAKAATQNEKKAAKSATWIKLGQVYNDAYNAVQGNGYIGASEAELGLLMTGVKTVKAPETVDVQGQPMTVVHYETADYYFANGQLAIIVATKEAVPDPLGNALAAFAKAGTIDDGKKTKDISAGIAAVHDKYATEAVTAYQFKDYAKSSQLFEAALNASLTAPYSQVDTNAMYNAGLTAWIANDVARAKVFFDRCLEYGYHGEDGDVYARLATIAEKEGNKELSVKYLEDGFVTYPKSQSILIGLINYYTTTGGSTDRLFELLDVAKANEPNNASLWYVEGNICLKLDPPQVERAFASYDKCAEINPAYEYGYIGKGVYLYNRAAELSDKANNEYDDAKYMALVAQFQQALKDSIEPFEKAFEVTADSDIKTTVAEYIKNACFRFREDPEYQAKYEKYNAFVTKDK